LPDPLSRRHLLDGALEASKALALANQYLEEGREVEAVDFFAVAHAASSDEARAALVTLRDAALERGDVFLMRVSSRALGEEPAQEIWQAVADAATRGGRLKDAETAHRLATVGG
jgi:hypothetical protein